MRGRRGPSAAGAKFVKEVMRGLSEGHNEEVLKKVRQVGKEEVRAGDGRDDISGVFGQEGKGADVLVTCGKELVEVSSFFFFPTCLACPPSCCMYEGSAVRCGCEHHIHPTLVRSE